MSEQNNYGNKINISESARFGLLNENEKFAVTLIKNGECLRKMLDDVEDFKSCSSSELGNRIQALMTQVAVKKSLNDLGEALSKLFDFYNVQFEVDSLVTIMNKATGGDTNDK